MKEHLNFYENIAEALIRLRGTVVLYDGEPFYISALANHKPDGIIRAYCIPIEHAGGRMPAFMNDIPTNSPSMGQYYDNWLETPEGKASPVIRKQLNSPLFNKFRPFPLGMCNQDGTAYYVERQPARKTEQGLIRSMLDCTNVSVSGSIRLGKLQLDMFNTSFRACILAEHPDAGTVLRNLLDPSIENDAVAFHRDFALTRGPIDTIYLAYKSDVVGLLRYNDFSQLELGKKFKHCREVIMSLGLFSQVQ